ncbi:IS3 family transposase [Paraburkholderia hospita]
MRNAANFCTLYNAKRIKVSLGALSPLEYRESLGMAA